jgi:hypothetical protein
LMDLNTKEISSWKVFHSNRTTVCTQENGSKSYMLVSANMDI